MKNEKLTNFLNKDIVKLIAVIFSILLLILISVILFEDIDLDNRILIYNIFGTLALAGFLYSYSLTKKNTPLKLSMGITRKTIYFGYLKNTIFSLLTSLFIAVFYMLIYNLVIYKKFSILEVFDLREVVFLPMVYLILSSLGFFLGVYKLQSKIFYSLSVLIAVILVLVIIFFGVAYWLTIVLFTFGVSFQVINYFLFMRYNL
jgi:hypothetical protein